MSWSERPWTVKGMKIIRRGSTNCSTNVNRVRPPLEENVCIQIGSQQSFDPDFTDFSLGTGGAQKSCETDNVTQHYGDPMS